jgi:hypothetical protein
MTLQKVIHEGNVSEYQSSDCEPLSKTNKSKDTWYQNTSGSALVVMLSFSPENDDTITNAHIHVNSTESDRTIMRVNTGKNSADNATFMVPNGHYYKVTNEVDAYYEGVISIDRWTETSLI